MNGLDLVKHAAGVAVGIALALLRPSVCPAAETVVYSFQGGSDGAEPQARLLNVNGALFGTTRFGGADNEGTVFTLNPGTGTESVFYSFGTASEQPQSDLIDGNGLFYGTTTSGGPYGGGAAFSLDPGTGAETVLHDFGNFDGGDGQGPTGGLIEIKGKLYGTTAIGGTLGTCNGSGCGIVFSIDPVTGKEKVLHAFADSEGHFPNADLIAIMGTLYGSTEWGGGSDAGTVFAMDRKTGNITLLHAFGGAPDGSRLLGSLLDVGGTLYGTTTFGGTGNCSGGEGCGTVFSIAPTTGVEKVLYSFTGGSDGNGPVAGLLEWNDVLYGTTAGGGIYNGGTVFSFDPRSGTETVLHSFGKGSDGNYPAAPLIRVGKRLYGTTMIGGTYSEGTIFSVKP